MQKKLKYKKLVWKLCLFAPFVHILGSRDGAVVRALAYHQCVPMWFDPRTQCQIWVEFVVGSLHCPERFFLRVL